MLAQKSVSNYMFLVLIVFNVSVVLSIKREKQNVTDNLVDKERDPRQWGGYPAGGPGFGDYGLSSFGGPIESIIIGLLVVAGFVVIGIPFFLLFLGLFNGGGGLYNGGIGGTGIGGLNLVPTATTSVNGRKKRGINSLLPEVNPMIEKKLINAFENFIRTPDKIKIIEKLLDSMVAN